MRYLLLFFGLALLAGCSDDKNSSGQRLDFVGSTRLTSSNRTVSAPGDTLASRIYADANDAGQPLSRLRITVKYMPRRNPFLYPTPVSSFSRDSIDNNPDPDFIYLDTLLTSNPTNLLFTSVFGTRTTAGTERWQYELRSADGSTVNATRAFLLNMRRADSLDTFHDYTLKLDVPASGTSARRFLQLRAGLALPAYTVLGGTTPVPPATTPVAPSTQQQVIQGLTDLILLRDGLTLVTPTAPTLNLNAQRWKGTRRNTRIYLASGQTAATFVNQVTDANITALYTSAPKTTDGTSIGPVAADQVYAFQTAEGRHGLLLVVSIPSSTTTSSTAGLQLRVRMAK